MSGNDLVQDKTTWATGGGLLLGLGAGFAFYFPHAIFGFVGCIIGGLGLGLLVTSLLSAFERRR